MDTSRQGRQERDSKQKSKKIEVYAIRFLVSTKGQVKPGQFAYTVMSKTPPGCVAVEYQSQSVAQRQALGNRDAEIGIATFMDNAPLRHFEKEAFQRRHTIKSGLRGRPRKAKAFKHETAFGRKPIKPVAVDNQMTGSS